MQKKKILKRLKYANAASAVVDSSNKNKRGKRSAAAQDSDSLLENVWSTCGNDYSSAGQLLFESLLLGSVKPAQFFSEYHEKKPLVQVNAKPSTNPFASLVQSKQLPALLNSGKLSTQTCALIKCNAEDATRTTKPYSSQTWESLIPASYTVHMSFAAQTNDSLFKLQTLLEAYFTNVTVAVDVVWCNGAEEQQSTLPHYLAADVYLLQCEGTRTWVVYEPDDSELFPVLPTAVGSTDFHASELTGLQRTEYTLNQGDVLYIPRGFVFHDTLSASSSLHIQLSVGVLTKGNLLQRAVSKLVETAHQRNVELRKSLPSAIASQFGLQFMDEDMLKPKREQFQLEMLQLVKKTISLADIDLDSAMDELQGEWMFSRQAPKLEDEDDEEEEEEPPALRMDSELEVTVVGAARIVLENGLAVVRHCMKNTRVFQEMQPRGLEFDLDDGPVLQAVLESTGPFEIKSLPAVLTQPGEQEEEFGGRVRVLQAMIAEGIVRVIKL